MCYIPSFVIEEVVLLLGLLCITFSADCDPSSKVPIFSNIKIRILCIYYNYEKTNLKIAHMMDLLNH
jgi:hypothetical protein